MAPKAEPDVRTLGSVEDVSHQATTEPTNHTKAAADEAGWAGVRRSGDSGECRRSPAGEQPDVPPGKSRRMAIRPYAGIASRMGRVAGAGRGRPCASAVVTVSATASHKAA